LLRSTCEHNRIELEPKIFYRDVLPNFGAGNESDALGCHLFETPIDDVLLHLELWDAVA
jgi:hypothetical protein